MAQTVANEDVIEVLKSVYDPEIPVNVVDLGLIYDVQVTCRRYLPLSVARSRVPVFRERGSTDPASSPWIGPGSRLVSQG